MLVYQRTDSPLLSAITFAISYLPWLLGGPLLSALADRLPRHRVLIATDVARAVLLALWRPRMPLPVLLGLLLLVSLCAPPFESARSALMADVLDGDRYAVATSLTELTPQLAQVVGFLAGRRAGRPRSPLGGAAASTPHLRRLGAVAVLRPAAPARAARRGRRGAASLWQDTGDGLRFIGRTPRLLAIVGVLWVGALFAYASEGIAAPLATSSAGDDGRSACCWPPTRSASTIGGLVVGRLCAPHRRDGWSPRWSSSRWRPCCWPAWSPCSPGRAPTAFALVLGLLFVAGLGAAWPIPLNVSFVQAVPSAYRGRAFGVAVSGLYGVQGSARWPPGRRAEGVAPSTVVALSGGLGLLAVVPALAGLRRTQGHMAAPAAAEGRSAS